MQKQISILTICVVLLSLILINCSSDKTTALWNGTDFTGFELFVPGDSVDVNDVWSVKDGVIHCTGVPNGYFRTEAEYSNYTLYV